jgi:hypothetical protein
MSHPRDDLNSRGVVGVLPDHLQILKIQHDPLETIRALEVGSTGEGEEVMEGIRIRITTTVMR